MFDDQDQFSPIYYNDELDVISEEMYSASDYESGSGSRNIKSLQTADLTRTVL